jgi:hypothetical protein
MHLRSLLCSAAAFAAVEALTYKAPASTSIDDGSSYSPDGWTPAPTTKPKPQRELRRRAIISADVLGYNAPDNTCGYINGIESELS